MLIDFWAYSCINCQRSLPHVVAWNKAYKKAGLDIIGIQSPEYAFEKVPSNVEAAAKGFGITYPVAIDNNLATWTNYRNRYWPADYLVDAKGVVRHIQFGEGDYSTTESLIRQLLVGGEPERAAAGADRSAGHDAQGRVDDAGDLPEPRQGAELRRDQRPTDLATRPSAIRRARPRTRSRCRASGISHSTASSPRAHRRFG